MHNCLNDEGSYHCSCRDGYALAADGKICSDINECITGIRCDHICVNSNGSFHCECVSGYLLNEADGKSCIGLLFLIFHHDLLFYWLIFPCFRHQ